MRYFKLITFILLIIIAGCATQKTIVQKQSVVRMELPPGIDSMTVMIADTIFSEVAVTEKQEQQAMASFNDAEKIWELGDSLWLATELDSFTLADSIRSSRQLTASVQYYESNKDVSKKIKKLKKKYGFISTNVIREVSAFLMNESIKQYQYSIELNIFNIDFRLNLVQRFETIGTRLKDKYFLNLAVNEFEKIIDQIKDDHRFYFRLGKLYFDLVNWPKAFDNFEKATETIRKTAIFQINQPQLFFSRPDSAPLDTTALVNYIYHQALCKTRLYDANPALNYFREAQEITPLVELKKTFQEWIDWILWDDGNIRASELRDAADTLRKADKFLPAKTAYLNLLPLLKTQRTFDQISWRIAVLDYANLNNKYAGLRRMHKLIKRSATDSLTGAPADTAYQVYFDSYGTMCYNTGAEYLKIKLSAAYVYFSQAADVRYNDRGKAYLQLAMLSEFDPKETIRLCNKAQELSQQLDAKETEILYKLFHTSYRKLGDFTASKEWFDKWKQL